MGLDMYLYRHSADEASIENQLADDGPLWKGDDFQAYDAWKKNHEVAYWRKAHAIHKWFVDSVQGGVDECQYSEPFGREVLAGLVERCRRVLAGVSDATDALPTRSGFFFGGTDYDEYYRENLEETIKMLEPLIAERNTDTFVYHSSW